MQQTTGVAILATQLRSTDRRALSQAWYSALHLAERESRTAGPRRSALSAARAAGSAAPRRLSSLAAPGTPRSAARALPDNRRDGTRVEASGSERRAPKTELARAIERGLVRRTVRTGVTAFTVRAAGGRICVLVRGDGEAARMIAVCAPPLRERVERALAAARFALAARPVRAEAGS